MPGPPPDPKEAIPRSCCGRPSQRHVYTSDDSLVARSGVILVPVAVHGSSQSPEAPVRDLIWLGTLALLLSPAVAWSQEPPRSFADPGSRIRITELQAGKSRRRSGTVVTAAADTVVLRLDGRRGTTTCSLARISGLGVSR